jgi:hypothetical protein
MMRRPPMHGAATTLLLAAVLVGVAVTAEPLAAADPGAPPAVDFQAVPARDRMLRDERLAVFLIVSNRSPSPLRDLRLESPEGSGFQVEGPSPMPAGLPAYATAQLAVTVRAGREAVYGAHKLPLVLRYAWGPEEQSTASAQSAVVAFTLARRLEEEAKGLPGGTAAFLYLLLPILPAFLAYQTVERLRRGEPLAVPSFKSEHLVPAFFLAVVVNFLALVLAKRDVGLEYSDPRVFVSVLLLSLVVGAVAPGLGWLTDRWRLWRWGITPADSPAAYLRKALLRPGAPRRFEWAKGTAARPGRACCCSSPTPPSCWGPVCRSVRPPTRSSRPRRCGRSLPARCSARAASCSTAGGSSTCSRRSD